MLQAILARTSQVLLGLIVCVVIGPTAGAQVGLTPDVRLTNPMIRDQDDMCIWIHPTDRSLSTIITSDKVANHLFVYDLAGVMLQAIPFGAVADTGMPGNVDIRYNFELSGGRVDLVAVNDRVNRMIVLYQADSTTRLLSRIDDGQIRTGGNYGLCMYKSRVTGRYYVFTTAMSGRIEQYELVESPGGVGASRVRAWDIGGQTEGCVCDDENGVAFFGEELVGIWKVAAEPQAPTDSASVAAVGDASGLTADVEGLTIYYAADGNGYLIASSQGSSQYKVYARKPPHEYLQTLTIANTIFSDGIDVSNVNFGPAFPFGLFAAHNDRYTFRPVEVCRFEGTGLATDTQYWNPRDRPVPVALSLAAVHAEPSRVRLAWYAAGSTPFEATVYRRTQDSDWIPAAAIWRDGSGYFRFEDTDVQPGARIAYRLGMVDGGQEVYAGEVWVSVPHGYGLALEGARPNPAVRDLALAFSLAEGGPASLAIFDVAGRRHWSRRVDDLGPGSHVLVLGRQLSLAPGVYVARISQGSRVISRRMVVSR